MIVLIMILINATMTMATSLPYVPGFGAGVTRLT